MYILYNSSIFRKVIFSTCKKIYTVIKKQVFDVILLSTCHVVDDWIFLGFCNSTWLCVWGGPKFYSDHYKYLPIFAESLKRKTLGFLPTGHRTADFYSTIFFLPVFSSFRKWSRVWLMEFAEKLLNLGTDLLTQPSNSAEIVGILHVIYILP